MSIPTPPPRTAVDPTAERPLYRQLADLLRGQIATGEIPPGCAVPGENVLARDHRIGRETVRQAIAILRAEGLITTSRGTGSRVRRRIHRTNVRIGTGDRVIARMPTAHERDDLLLDDGVPILELHRRDGTTELHPADRTALTTAAGGAARAINRQPLATEQPCRQP